MKGIAKKFFSVIVCFTFLNAASDYRPPPPRYGPPELPHYYEGTPKPIYTPPPPRPNPPPKKNSSIIFSKVEAAKVVMPYLPERIRYRHSRRGPAKIIFQPVEIPRYFKPKEPPIYTQRQPKRPSLRHVPSRPGQSHGGSYPRKKFQPPNARYK